MAYKLASTKQFMKMPKAQPQNLERQIKNNCNCFRKTRPLDIDRLQHLFNFF